MSKSEVPSSRESLKEIEFLQRQYKEHLAKQVEADQGGLSRNQLTALISEHKKAVKDGKGNLPESTQRLRRILANAISYEMPDQKLQKMWEVIETLRFESDTKGTTHLYNQECEENLNLRGPSRNNLCENTAIEQYEWFTSIRRYPPPETVLAIGEIFKYYLDARGSLSLDEAFFGEPHRKKQSLAFKLSRENEFTEIDREIFLSDIGISSDKNKETREKIVQRVKGDSLRISPENYMRGFNQWKAKHNEGDKQETEKKS